LNAARIRIESHPNHAARAIELVEITLHAQSNASK